MHEYDSELPCVDIKRVSLLTLELTPKLLSGVIHCTGTNRAGLYKSLEGILVVLDSTEPDYIKV